MTNSTDPTQNIQGGLAYLQQLLQQYGGDVSTALWAYNAGPGNVAAGNLPAQTANYIPAVENAQSTWASALGTSVGSTASDLSSDVSSESTDDNTVLYLGLALGVGALALALWA